MGQRLGAATLAAVLLAQVCLSQESPEWARHEYNASASRVFAAALVSIQGQKHEVQEKNEGAHIVDFHVGLTAWSWGYNMRLVVTPIDEGHSQVTVGVLRSGGKVVSWGSGKKEVRKIFAGIDAELSMLEATASQPTSHNTQEATNSTCDLEVISEPKGADVELDGKFTGSTPAIFHLKPGDYTITLRKSGYSAWTRKVTLIPANQSRVVAELRKAQ
jgi:hypothetical protein